MSNPVLVDVKDLLVNAAVGAFGGTADWGIFISKEPDRPDKCITLYDTPGEAPHPKFLLDYPRFQVRVRSDDYLSAYQKADAVKSALLALPSQDFNGTRYVGIWMVFDISFLKTDERERAILVATYRVIREPTTGTNREVL